MFLLTCGSGSYLQTVCKFRNPHGSSRSRSNSKVCHDRHSYCSRCTHRELSEIDVIPFVIVLASARTVKGVAVVIFYRSRCNRRELSIASAETDAGVLASARTVKGVAVVIFYRSRERT